MKVLYRLLATFSCALLATLSSAWQCIVSRYAPSDVHHKTSDNRLLQSGVKLLTCDSDLKRHLIWSALALIVCSVSSASARCDLSHCYINQLLSVLHCCVQQQTHFTSITPSLSLSLLLYSTTMNRLSRGFWSMETYIQLYGSFIVLIEV